MTKVDAAAPAKVNLTLHVTGQRANGYHLLDSLVVFASVADRLSVTPAPDLRLTVRGPFSTGVPRDDTNIVMRAATALARARGVDRGAAILLEKNLPHAAGIGGGSADAAATLGMLARFWGVEPLPAFAPEVAELGADVPVCLAGPGPMRMTGIGETLSPVDCLPDCALVLVNPQVAVPTAAVFAGLDGKENPAMDAIPARCDVAGFAEWLSAQRNDLLAPARAIAPAIEATLNRLRAIPAVLHAGMSGSGATCYGLVRDMADARHVARAVQVAEMGWWVAPAHMLQVMRATT